MHQPEAEAASAVEPGQHLRPGVAGVLVLALGTLIWLTGAWQEATWVPSQGWRLLAVFLATILALMLHPIPGGAAVLLGVMGTVVLGGLKLERALSGYSHPSVWLVLAAFFIARAFIKTGLARRIALLFIRLLGGSTLGLSYALAATDTLLASMIPSNAARVGGVLLPVTRSLAELYGSFPDRSAGLIGRFLMLSLYQTDVVACALFLTGQAGNPLAAEQARELTDGVVVLSYGAWFWYALAPAVAALAVIPALVFLWQRPTITHTPEAVQMARRELEKMGRPGRDERILLAVFLCVCGLWFGLGAEQTALVALGGALTLLLFGVLTWEDAISERAAWDVFVWYGGLVLMGKELADTHILRNFAAQGVGLFEGWGWLPLFLITLLIYFYAHYAFASITTHLVAMYPAFVPVLLEAGAPPWLAACTFAYFANFAAGLTHYGTTPGPIIFSVGYVSQRVWWRVGGCVSLVNIAIWLVVGMAWWKVVGLW